MNINSLRYKFDEIKEISLDKVVDCLIISKTKLDSSFKDSLFEVDGYKLQRRDRTDHGGGIATFMRAEITARRRFDIEWKTLENIVYEITLENTKWLIYAMYRPPSMANDIFTNHMNTLLDKGTKFIDHYMVIGDLNYDIMIPEKSHALDDLCDIFDLGTDHLTCRGGLWLFVSFRIFFPNTRVRIIFFCHAKRNFFFQNLTLGYMTKTLNHIIFFSPPKSEYFFQQLWESQYFFRKKPVPPFKLNGRSVSNNMIKHSQTVLLKNLQFFFNFCLSSGIYPNS